MSNLGTCHFCEKTGVEVVECLVCDQPTCEDCFAPMSPMATDPCTPCLECEGKREDDYIRENRRKPEKTTCTRCECSDDDVIPCPDCGEPTCFDCFAPQTIDGTPPSCKPCVEAAEMTRMASAIEREVDALAAIAADPCKVIQFPRKDR